MEEEFRVIPEHPQFRVSNLGNVESCLSGTWKRRNLKRVNKGTNHGGRIYLGFNVPLEEKLPSGQRRTKTLLVHNEIAKLFIGPRPPKMNVLHRDDNRSNNTLDNLMYGSQSLNVQQAWQNHKIVAIRSPDGRFNGSISTSSRES